MFRYWAICLTFVCFVLNNNTLNTNAREFISPHKTLNVLVPFGIRLTFSIQHMSFEFSFHWHYTKWPSYERIVIEICVRKWLQHEFVYRNYFPIIINWLAFDHREHCINQAFEGITFVHRNPIIRNHLYLTLEMVQVSTCFFIRTENISNNKWLSKRWNWHNSINKMSKI